MRKLNLMTVTNGLMVITILLLLSAIGLIAYDRIIDLPSFEILSHPIEVVGGEARRGEKVPLMVTQCNHSKQTMIVRTTRNLFNLNSDLLTILPNSEVEIAPGCSRVRYSVDTIPPDLPPGDYVLFGRASVHEWMHTHYALWQSERFKVLP